MKNFRNTGRFPVGESCQVQAGALKYHSFLRGVCFPEYILMDTPLANGKPLTLQRGAFVTTRFISDGVAYGFETELVKTYTRPAMLWVVEYPVEFKTATVRQSERIGAFLPTMLEIPGIGISGALVNISEIGGLFSYTAKAGRLLKKESMGLLTITLPCGALAEKLPVVVRNVSHGGAKTFVGLEFTSREGAGYTAFKLFYDDCKTAGRHEYALE